VYEPLSAAFEDCKVRFYEFGSKVIKEKLFAKVYDLPPQKFPEEWKFAVVSCKKML
jgi:hypothetical protein